MKTNTQTLRKPIATLLLFAFSIIANAQKLPKVQIASLRLPDNVKIDGKATEWDNKFQAYNTNTEVFYTMANDDDKLYLIIQATDQLVIRKIMAASITVSIDLSAADKSAHDVTVTYPVFDKKEWPNINLKNKPEITKNELVDRKRLDSFMNVANRELANKSKEIKVFGIKGIDTSISVYNEDGIRAVSLFDHQIAYTYELAIPLKYLSLSLNGVARFSYNIKLNGSSSAEGSTIEDIPGGTRVNGPGKMADMQFMRYPTDFSGSYTLIKN